MAFLYKGVIVLGKNKTKQKKFEQQISKIMLLRNKIKKYE